MSSEQNVIDNDYGRANNTVFLKTQLWTPLS